MTRRLPALLPDDPPRPCDTLRAFVRRFPGVRCPDALRATGYRAHALPLGVVGVWSRLDACLRLFPPTRRVYGHGPVVVWQGGGDEGRGWTLDEARRALAAGSAR